MSRAELIALVWRWDKFAVERNMGAEKRRGIWRILDALYDDMAFTRTPGFRAKVKAALDGLKQSEEVLAVRKELNL
jgi:hypothetical protein